MSDISCRELPGIPESYCEFLSSGPDLTADALMRRASEVSPGDRLQVAAVLVSAQAAGLARWCGEAPLDLATRVPVVASLRVSPGCGLLSDLLKALTALGLAGCLERKGIPSVAVVVVDDRTGPWPSSVVVPDSEGRLRTISTLLDSGGPTVPDEEVRRFFGDPPDSRISEVLQSIGETARNRRAFVAWFAGILPSGSNCVILDGHGVPGLELSVPVRVIGPDELPGNPAAFRGLLWPKMSATLLEPRARKAFARYGLAVRELFSGPEVVVEVLGYRSSRDGVRTRFDALESAIRTRIAGSAVPGSAVEQLAGDAHATAESLLYQTGRLRERFETLIAQRQESVLRQISRLCDTTAPGGRLQESVLALPWYLQRFSQDLPSVLLERLDPFSFSHRLVDLE